MVLIQRAQIAGRDLGCDATAAAAIGQRRGLHIIATDSMAAKGMVERRYSSSEAARRLLREFQAMLDGDHVYLFWIPSAANPADGLSRLVISRCGVVISR